MDSSGYEGTIFSTSVDVLLKDLVSVWQWKCSEKYLHYVQNNHVMIKKKHLMLLENVLNQFCQNTTSERWGLNLEFSMDREGQRKERGKRLQVNCWGQFPEGRNWRFIWLSGNQIYYYCSLGNVFPIVSTFMVWCSTIIPHHPPKCPLSFFLSVHPPPNVLILLQAHPFTSPLHSSLLGNLGLVTQS